MNEFKLNRGPKWVKRIRRPSGKISGQKLTHRNKAGLRGKNTVADEKTVTQYEYMKQHEDTIARRKIISISKQTLIVDEG